MKRKKGRHLLCETHDLKCGFVEAHQSEFSVSMLCEVLGVARSSYYHWRARREREPSERERKNAELLEKIKGVFEKNKGRYGSSRIHAELKKQQVACSLGRVKRLRTRPNGWDEKLATPPRRSTVRSAKGHSVAQKGA